MDTLFAVTLYTLIRLAIPIAILLGLGEYYNKHIKDYQSGW